MKCTGDFHRVRLIFFIRMGGVTFVIGIKDNETEFAALVDIGGCLLRHLQNHGRCSLVR